MNSIPRLHRSFGTVVRLGARLLVLVSLFGLAPVATADLAPGRAGIDDPVTLHLRGADLADLFLTIRQLSGWNIVIGPDVRGKISIDLDDAPLRTVLTLVARQHDLAYDDDGRILVVETRTSALRHAKEGREREEPPPTEFHSDASMPTVSTEQVAFSVFETIEKRPFRLTGPGAASPVASALLDFSRGSAYELSWSRPFGTRHLPTTGRVRVTRLDESGEGRNPILVVDFLDGAPPERRLACSFLPNTGAGMTFGLEPWGEGPIRQNAVAKPYLRDPFRPPGEAPGNIGRIEAPTFGSRRLRVSLRITELVGKGTSAVVTPVVELADGARGTVAFRLLGLAERRDANVTIRFVAADVGRTFDLAAWVVPETGVRWGYGVPESAWPFRATGGIAPGEWRPLFPSVVSAGGRRIRVEFRVEKI